ncbi:MAG: hypothetical protein LVR00_02780 [Rhabdochlamydiaceae bacterium]|jgi:hypothetical protein
MDSINAALNSHAASNTARLCQLSLSFINGARVERFFYQQIAKISILSFLDTPLSYAGFHTYVIELGSFFKKNWKDFLVTMISIGSINKGVDSFLNTLAEKINFPATETADKRFLSSHQIQWTLRLLAICGTTLLADRCIAKVSSTLIAQDSERWAAYGLASIIYNVHTQILIHLLPKIHRPHPEDLPPEIEIRTLTRITIINGIMTLVLASKHFINRNPIYINALFIPASFLAERAIRRHVTEALL